MTTKQKAINNHYVTIRETDGLYYVGLYTTYNNGKTYQTDKMQVYTTLEQAKRCFYRYTSEAKRG